MNNGSHNNDRPSQRSAALRAVLLALPFPVIFLAVTLVFLWGFREVYDRVPQLKYMLRRTETVETTVRTTPDPLPHGEESEDSSQSAGGYSGGIAYGDQWAVLNVEGWVKRDIRIYEGDSDELLSLGAGHWAASRFPGQNGKVVLSAHVMTDFYELETTPVGAKVMLNTIYGLYTYRVAEVRVFHESAVETLYPQDGAEVLLLYTCYPRSVGIARTAERCALICEPAPEEGAQ